MRCDGVEWIRDRSRGSQLICVEDQHLAVNDDISSTTFWAVFLHETPINRQRPQDRMLQEDLGLRGCGYAWLFFAVFSFAAFFFRA